MPRHEVLNQRALNILLLHCTRLVFMLESLPVFFSDYGGTWGLEADRQVEAVHFTSYFSIFLHSKEKEMY